MLCQAVVPEFVQMVIRILPDDTVIDQLIQHFLQFCCGDGRPEIGDPLSYFPNAENQLGAFGRDHRLEHLPCRLRVVEFPQSIFDESGQDVLHAPLFLVAGQGNGGLLWILLHRPTIEGIHDHLHVR